MSPYYSDDLVTLHHGDCLDVLRTLPDCSVDSVVTDPPYGLGFMGKEWDSPTRMVGQDNAPTGGGSNYFKRKGDEGYTPGNAAWYGHNDPRAFGDWCELWAAECLRVLKPGGHMLAFGGTRTWHRLACAVEDAGFEIRDSIAWLYGSGFPKSRDVAKAINVEQGERGERVPYTAPDGKGRPTAPRNWRLGGNDRRSIDRELPATPDAERWQGWGTALKPAFEPVVVARKPLTGTVAGNVLQWGTGAINVDGCRVEGVVPQVTQGLSSDPSSWEPRSERRLSNPNPAGRWPANVVLDESQAAVLDEQSGTLTSGLFKPEHADNGKDAGTFGAMGGRERDIATYGDTGGASRFFYVAKAPATERIRVNGTAHPTVKPLALMRWLVRLVTPPGGTVLEPFAGSGTTVEACLLEGFRCVAIERETDYLPLIRQRINRRRDPVAAVRGSGEDGGLFDLLDGGAA